MEQYTGLSSQEATARISQVGFNTLPEPKRASYLQLFFSQFKSPLIAILIAAAGIMYLSHDISDSIVIGIVLLFNAVIGTLQEGKAQATLLSLKKLTSTMTAVIRDGKETSIESKLLVPKDLLVLREGDKIAADGRIISDEHFEVNEATLTGESIPVHKTADETQEERDFVFKGTYVTSGQALVEVTATGVATRIGGIARQLTRIDTDVPLKGKVAHLSRSIIMTVGLFVVFFLILSTIRGNTLLTSLETAVTITVSIIPEGLPVILTLVLAFSVSRMSKRNALVKKLQAVEALGGATIIAVDKTGTITLNELSVEQLYTPDHQYQVTGKGFDPHGEIIFDGKPLSNRNHHDLVWMLTCLAASTTAHVRKNNENLLVPVGDPTEVACVVLSKKYKGDLLSVSVQKHTPFDYRKKYSQHSIKDSDGRLHTITIGAPESILSLCSIPSEEKARTQVIIEKWQHDAKRVIAVADGRKFVGILGMQDSIHPEAADAIKLAQGAGIRVVMITGDHEDTAVAIARKVGIYRDGDQILTGVEIENMPVDELARTLISTHTSHTVFARVTPEHKLKIIEAFRKNKEVIAMTGDGVNDAASLVAADLGIAMGKRGTEVAKDAADIILLDDNFKSITAAIKEGRGLYLALKNVILYLFSTSTGEALTLTLALILGLPLPILPVQILWLNFVTDGFLDVALSMEPREHGILKRSWNSADNALVDRTMFTRMVIVGVTMAIGSLFVFSQYTHIDMTKALTLSLTTLAAFQWLNAWNCRSSTKSLLELPLFGNWALVAATVIIVLLQIIATSTTFMQQLLHTTSLSPLEWVMCLGIASTIILVEEVRKMIAAK